MNVEEAEKKFGNILDEHGVMPSQDLLDDLVRASMKFAHNSVQEYAQGRYRLPKKDGASEES